MNSRNTLLTIVSVACATCIAAGTARAAHEDHAGPSHEHYPYGPIGVMGEHTHPEGNWMMSYRYMLMDMDGNRSGTERISTSEVLADFRVAPTDMTMSMHMLGAMWAPTEDITAMLMLPYVRKEMDHLTRMGGTFTTEAEGVGDLKASVLINIVKWEHQKIHINAGLSLPTGSIDEEDETPMGKVRLPYPMQLGSGTFDFYPGVTYLGHLNKWSWGGQILGTVRLGENSNDYTLGDRISGTTWGIRKWCEWFSNSLRLKIESWDTIDGSDSQLNPALVPTADPDLRGGMQLDVGIGGELLGQRGFLKDHRLAIELELPVYQHLDGPQLETDMRLTLGWQRIW
jgi:hypothetical protein